MEALLLPMVTKLDLLIVYMEFKSPKIDSEITYFDISIAIYFVQTSYSNLHMQYVDYILKR